MSSPESSLTIADLVRTRRSEMGITQNDLAELLDMSQEWLSALEQGRIKSPRMTTLRAMAAKMSIALEDLVVAAQLATSRAGAQKVIESPGFAAPEDNGGVDWDDPSMQIVMSRVGKMSPQQRRRLAELMDSLGFGNDDD